jgi:hypothetical protein
MGFHQATIARGVYGQLSKIQEELDEARDAEAQGQDLMLLIELADIIGAVAGVAQRYGFTLGQLAAFARLRSEVAREEQVATGDAWAQLVRDRVLERLRVEEPRRREQIKKTLEKFSAAEILQLYDGAYTTAECGEITKLTLLSDAERAKAGL